MIHVSLKSGKINKLYIENYGFESAWIIECPSIVQFDCIIWHWFVINVW